MSFDVPEGQFLGITGPNGCGKSTLLKILSRIYRPDGGSVAVNGEVSAFLELGVGFNPELTARENIFLGGAVLGLTHNQLEEQVDPILQFADLTEFADMKIKNYSSGMQVRLAFTVAISARADILLMDEVLAVGDAQFQEKCFDTFTRLKNEGKTIILVTHALDTLEQYCDRVLLLEHGRIIADGSASEVTSTYRRITGAASEAAAPVAEPVDASQISGGGDEAPRWGSGELTVVRTSLTDSEGRERRSFATGDSITIRFEFVVKRDVGQFAALLGFRKSDGLLLSGPSTQKDSVHIACPPRGHRGTVVYEVKALPLLSGHYVLSVGLYDKHGTHAYDNVEKVLDFHVVDDRGRVGIVDTSGSWHVEVADDTSTEGIARSA